MIANVGSSRCVIISEEGCQQLTMEHNLSLEEERNRIISCGGLIYKSKENNKEIGEEKVWIKKNINFGLSASRSIGDIAFKKIGVIPDPGKDLSNK